jgi:hypothetical protein
MQNNGKPCHLLRTEDEEYLFTDFKLWNQLVQDALDFVEGWKQSTQDVFDFAEALKNLEKSFCDMMTEEEYDRISKVVIHPKDGTISVLK